MSEAVNEGATPTLAEIVCRHCGERLPASAKYCGKCGRPVTDDRQILLAYAERAWVALSARQQRLFAGLSLLVGDSFPRAAALALYEATGDDNGAQQAERDPKGDLASLVSFALVEALPDGERLRLLPPLREYAAERLKALAPAEQARLGSAVVAYWLAYAEAHAGYEGVSALEAESDGLMGAVAWAYAQGRYRAVLGLAHALRQAWNIGGRREEELKLYTWASRAAQKLGDLQEQRWAIHQLAVVHHQLGRLVTAQTSYERALTLAWQLGDLTAEQEEVYALALLDRQAGRLEKARAGYVQVLALARQLGDLVAEWEGIHALAELDHQAGRLEEARADYERALVLARRLGAPAAEAVAAGNLGFFLAQQGERERGRGLINESLEISKRLGKIDDMGKCHQFLAWLDSEEGNRVYAIAHYREALRCFEQVQSPDAEQVRVDLRKLEADAALERPFKPEVVRAVRALLNDNASWKETRALLEREQALLLTDEADQFLGALIEQVQQGEAADAQARADYYAAHLFLLRDARASSIGAAWARFKRTNLLDEQDERLPGAAEALPSLQPRQRDSLAGG